MSSAHELLQLAAEDGSLDSEQWPRVLDYLLARLDEIINEFPKPALPKPQTQQNSIGETGSPKRPQQPLPSSQDPQTADKENAPPPRSTPPSRPPVPTFSHGARETDSAPKDSSDFPPEVLSFYSAIKTSLRKNFPQHPPHTIQRLAELVLLPKQRYRFLPTYLRALDRVVSVSSPTTLFPLPIAELPSTGGLLNGATPPPMTIQLGSDESLGGALLTPIPWLRPDRGSQSELISESTEIVEGPHGVGRIETVSVMNGTTPSSTAIPSGSMSTSTPNANGETTVVPESLQETGPVTQGELLRHEQEAGVVLSNPQTMVSQRTLRSMDANASDGACENAESTDEEAPHARGPGEMTMEDMGPQNATRGPGLDIEAAVGRHAIGHSSPEPEASGSKDEEMKDAAEAEAVEEKPPAETEDSTMEDKKEDETTFEA